MNLTSTDDAYNYALSLLARREHFTKELTDKLRRKGFSSEAVTETILRLQDHNYLNDNRATELFVKEAKRKKKGLLKIVNDLKTRGITTDATTVRVWYTYDEEKEAAQELLARHINASREKQYRFLTNRGFSSDIVRACLAEKM